MEIMIQTITHSTAQKKQTIELINNTILIIFINTLRAEYYRTGGYVCTDLIFVLLNNRKKL